MLCAPASTEISESRALTVWKVTALSFQIGVSGPNSLCAEPGFRNRLAKRRVLAAMVNEAIKCLHVHCTPSVPLESSTSCPRSGVCGQKAESQALSEGKGVSGF